MKILRFFQVIKYSKKLEALCDAQESEMKTLKNIIEVKDDMIKNRDKLIQDMQKIKEELAELKKTPPKKEYQCNIDISDPIFQRIIKSGRNVLVKRAHPDHGGSREELEKVEKAFEILKSLKIEPKTSSFGFGYSSPLWQQHAARAAAEAQQRAHDAFMSRMQNDYYRKSFYR